MLLRYIVTRPDGIVHAPVHPGDVGYDMEAVETVWLEPGAMADIPLGVAIELPLGWWADLRHRSSTPRKLGVMVHNGTIDNGYRGELFALTQNLSKETVVIARGTRFAQLVLFRCEIPQLVLVDRLAESVRGTAGFGSTTGVSSGPINGDSRHPPTGLAYPACVMSGCPVHPDYIVPRDNPHWHGSQGGTGSDRHHD